MYINVIHIKLSTGGISCFQSKHVKFIVIIQRPWCSKPANLGLPGGTLLSKPYFMGLHGHIIQVDRPKKASFFYRWKTYVSWFKRLRGYGLWVQTCSNHRVVGSKYSCFVIAKFFILLVHFHLFVGESNAMVVADLTRFGPVVFCKIFTKNDRRAALGDFMGYSLVIYNIAIEHGPW